MTERSTTGSPPPWSENRLEGKKKKVPRIRGFKRKKSETSKGGESREGYKGGEGGGGIG